jgi:hypothetical protein
MNHPTFIGWQELPKGIGGGKMALFNLTEKMGEHPVGSTVSDRMLMQNGWTVVQVAELVLWASVVPSKEYLALRSNGSPKVAASCEVVGNSVSELSESHLPPAIDAAGEQANRLCNTPAAS